MNEGTSKPKRVDHILMLVVGVVLVLVIGVGVYLLYFRPH